MKLKTYFNAALLCLAVGMFAACAGDNLADNKENKQEILQGVKFTINETKTSAKSYVGVEEDGAKTRTTIKHTPGLGADAYWNNDDYIWVKNNAGVWKKSISTMLNTERTHATFILPGNQSDYSDGCPVIYNISPSTSPSFHDSPEYLNINYLQPQTKANDFSMAGYVGDCGTGVAKSTGGPGEFSFQLQHNVSYLCFLPRCSNAALGQNLQLTKIVLRSTIPNDYIAANWCNVPSTGAVFLPSTFPSWAVNGVSAPLVTASVNNFPLSNSTAESPDLNATYMVILPGIHDFTITYTIKDKVTGFEAEIKKQVNGIDCKPGEINDITANLNVTRTYTNKYYAWDADEAYDIGHGYEASLPTVPYGKPGATYLPLSFFPIETRTYESDPAPYDKRLGHGYWPGANSNVTAQTNFFKNNTPNVNEALWYALKGDPHWDNTTPWVLHNHLYTGGMWLKKKSKICADEGITESYMENGFKADIGPLAGTYNTYQDYPDDGSAPTFDNTAASINTPLTNTTGYFFLPALGGYSNTAGSDASKVWLTDVGVKGGYWTSNCSLWETGMISFNIESGKVSVNMQDGPTAPYSITKFQ